jgi:hypothetical protein
MTLYYWTRRAIMESRGAATARCGNDEKANKPKTPSSCGKQTRSNKPPSQNGSSPVRFAFRFTNLTHWNMSDLFSRATPGSSLVETTCYEGAADGTKSARVYGTSLLLQVRNLAVAGKSIRIRWHPTTKPTSAWIRTSTCT